MIERLLIKGGRVWRASTKRFSAGAGGRAARAGWVVPAAAGLTGLRLPITSRFGQLLSQRSPSAETAAGRSGWHTGSAYRGPLCFHPELQ